VKQMTEPYIMITGALGYIGSQMVYFLQNIGFKLIAVDRKAIPLSLSYPGTRYFQLDLKDSHSLSALFNNYHIQSVIHFAGEISVTESVENPQKYFEENILATLSLLKVMRLHDCREIIFSSTAAVYGSPIANLIDETHPTNPISPYGQSKLMVEQILEAYRQAYHFNYVSLRYFNASGANIEACIGEEHEPETHLIPILLEFLEGMREKAFIYGLDYPTPDKSCIRDFIHIKDLASAHYKALEWLRVENKSNIFNLGSGRGSSVLEVVRIIESMARKTLPVTHSNARAGDPAILVANINKARDILCWEPYHSDIGEILHDAWHFLKVKKGELKLKA